ncbi:hypothetical protein QTP88_017793 [Uroleucon formosanum]
MYIIHTSSACSRSLQSSRRTVCPRIIRDRYQHYQLIYTYVGQVAVRYGELILVIYCNRGGHRLVVVGIFGIPIVLSYYIILLVDVL